MHPARIAEGGVEQVPGEEPGRCGDAAPPSVSAPGDPAGLPGLAGIGRSLAHQAEPRPGTVRRRHGPAWAGRPTAALSQTTVWRHGGRVLDAYPPTPAGKGCRSTQRRPSGRTI